MQEILPAACAAMACVGICAVVRAAAGSTDPKNRPAAVAYVPNAKKEAFFAALCSALDTRGIRMQPLRSDGNLAGGADLPLLIVHKLTDDIALAADSGEAAARLAAVKALTDANPSIVMLDPLPAIENVRDRRKMAAAVQVLSGLIPLPAGHENDAPSALQLTSATVRMPRTIEVLVADQAETLAGFPSGQPLVVKSAAACGTPEAHYMAVVESWEQVATLNRVAQDYQICPKFPVVVQPYIPHNGVVYKVYVVGSAPGRAGHPQTAARYYVASKPSLHLTPQIASSVPELLCGPSNGNHRRLLLFDALHPYRTAAGAALFQHAQSDDTDSPDRASSTEQLQAVPGRVLEALNKELQRVLGLTFFGYDLVCEEGTGDYWILDINYFPSYAGCEGVVAAVADTIEAHLLLSFGQVDTKLRER